MQQLDQGDAVFLSLETPSLPAHIGGLAFLKPPKDPKPGFGFSFDRFREFIGERFTGQERFACRVQQVPFGLDRPYWVRMDKFDARDHVMQIAVPAPYSHESLGKMVGRIFERPLDKSRPLWEMTLIEGLPGDSYVLLWKVHHCMMDGASGAGLVEQLFDMTPDAVRPPTEIGRPEIGGSPRNLEVALRAVRNNLDLPKQQRKYLAQALAGFLPGAGAETAAEEEDRPERAAAVTAPATIFNGYVGPHRGVAWSTISLEDVKNIKNALGVTVNDVLLSLSAGAVRAYLLDRDALPDVSMIASVPSSVRKEGDTSMGNQVSDMSIYWGTEVEDPIERVLAIHEDSRAAKEAARRDDSLNFMGVMSEALMPGFLSVVMKTIERAAERAPLPANVVVSNVPMTPFPLYCAGAQITKAVPISLLAPTQGLNITIISYCGEMHFGVVHDPDLVEDGWELAERMPKSLQEMQRALDLWQASQDSAK